MIRHAPPPDTAPGGRRAHPRARPVGAPNGPAPGMKFLHPSPLLPSPSLPNPQITRKENSISAPPPTLVLSVFYPDPVSTLPPPRSPPNPPLPFIPCIAISFFRLPTPPLLIPPPLPHRLHPWPARRAAPTRPLAASRAPGSGASRPQTQPRTVQRFCKEGERKTTQLEQKFIAVQLENIIKIRQCK